MKGTQKSTGRFLCQYSREASINISGFQMDALPPRSSHLHKCWKGAFLNWLQAKTGVFSCKNLIGKLTLYNLYITASELLLKN